MKGLYLIDSSLCSIFSSKTSYYKISSFILSGKIFEKLELPTFYSLLSYFLYSSSLFFLEFWLLIHSLYSVKFLPLKLLWMGLVLNIWFSLETFCSSFKLFYVIEVFWFVKFWSSLESSIICYLLIKFLTYRWYEFIFFFIFISLSWNDCFTNDLAPL